MNKNYILKVNDPYFQEILEETKRYEIRLYRGDRKNMKLGDECLIIRNSNKEQSLEVKITSLEVIKSLEELYKNPEGLGMNLIENQNEYLKSGFPFYSLNEIKEFGLLKIGISKI